MVCLSFMVGGFEDTWVFISTQKVVLTDFRKNLEGRERKILLQNHFLNNFKENSSYQITKWRFFSHWAAARILACLFLIVLRDSSVPQLLITELPQKTFHIILYTGGFSNLIPILHKHLYWQGEGKPEDLQKNGDWKYTHFLFSSVSLGSYCGSCSPSQWAILSL